MKEKYGLALGNSDRINDVITLQTLQSAVNSAAERLKNSPSPEANKAYKEALQKMLNHRAYVIQSVHARYIVPGDMKEDWALTADSLLSVGELKLINQSIKPVDGDVRSNPRGLASAFRTASVNRKTLRTWPGILEEADKIDADSANNPISGIPSNWEMNTLRGLLENRLFANQSGFLFAGRINSPELKEIIAQSFAAAAVDEYMNPGTMILRDSSSNFVGPIVINGINGKRATTDEESVAILASLDRAGSSMKLPGTAGTGTSGISVFVTNRGKEYKAKGYTQDGVLGYANDVYGVTILADVVREGKQNRDAGRRETDMNGGPSAWFSAGVQKGTMDLWEHVTIHEVGHMIAFRTNMSDREQGQGTAPSKYGRHSDNENFAEYYAMYIRTGQAPPWFIDLLRGRGLLKSQQNQ